MAPHRQPTTRVRAGTCTLRTRPLYSSSRAKTKHNAEIEAKSRLLASVPPPLSIVDQSNAYSRSCLVAEYRSDTKYIGGLRTNVPAPIISANAASESTATSLSSPRPRRPRTPPKCFDVKRFDQQPAAPSSLRFSAVPADLRRDSSQNLRPVNIARVRRRACHPSVRSVDRDRGSR
jgi:hypothetical protein